MLGMLDKKKNIGAMIIASRLPKKDGVKFEREMDGSYSRDDEEMGEVSIKDQMQACTVKIFRAINTDDKKGFIKAMFQLHEAIDQAIEEGLDLDEDEGKGEAGEELEDEGMED